MPVVTCPECSSRLKVPDQAAGRAAKCPKCQATVPLKRLRAAAPLDDEPEPSGRAEPMPLPDDESDSTERPNKSERAAKQSNRGSAVSGYALLAAVYVVGIFTGWQASRLFQTDTSSTVASKPAAQPPSVSTFGQPRSDTSAPTPAPAQPRPTAPKPTFEPQVQTNRNLPRDQLRALVSGKTEQQVLGALGKPDETTEGLYKNWFYYDVGVDSVTGKRNVQMRIMFDRGVVTEITF